METTLKNGTGLLTLPIESGEEKIVQELIQRWGADSIRNSDGTTYSDALKKLPMIKYTTLCLVRADQEYLRENRDKLQHNILMSEAKTACGDVLTVRLLDGFLRDQFEIDCSSESLGWWQVFDRTSGAEIGKESWQFDAKSQTVSILGCRPFHTYTVNFWAFHIWDSTSMYNHISNGWNCPHKMPENPVYPESREHLLAFLGRWCAENPETDVVRLTSLFYHFTNFFSEKSEPKYMDHVGYNDAASPYALECFKQAKGYALTLEDFVDQGYYNCFHRPPRKAFLDFIDFTGDLVVDLAVRLNQVIHNFGKHSMMFTSDHWIGAELYSGKLEKAGFDALVTACPNGTMYRRTADAPLSVVKEIRLQPYFFHNEFDRDGVPIEETRFNWSLTRRAMVRNIVDRIGFGGYISIPHKYPEYVDMVADICEEFRSIVRNTGKSKPYSLTGCVGVLNCWGRLRSWQAQPYWYEKFFRQNFMEGLSGLPFEVRFLSFEEILQNGIDPEIAVIVNAGAEGTAWSGGDVWKNPELVSLLRNWVYAGGGFVGIDEPTAARGKHRFFQLADVLGVDREGSFSANSKAESGKKDPDHFLRSTLSRDFRFSGTESFVYALSSDTTVVSECKGHIHLACNDYGGGRAVYISDLQYSADEVRLLYNALSWAGKNERCAHERWFCENPFVECAHFPSTGATVLLNNSGRTQETLFRDGDGRMSTASVPAYGSVWVSGGHKGCASSVSPAFRTERADVVE